MIEKKESVLLWIGTTDSYNHIRMELQQEAQQDTGSYSITDLNAVDDKDTTCDITDLNCNG